MEISICMMVKDEEKNIRRCLNSLKHILKNIDSELIIVDTGSKDKTVEISREYTDKIFFHPWENDFSGMRNKSIGYAKGKWILIIDADEEIINCDNIISFIKSSNSKKFKTGLLDVKNIQNLSDDTKYAMLKSPRLFVNDGEFHYEGIVHNNPIFKQPTIDLDTVIIHYGYIVEDEEILNKKFIRTSTLLKEALEKEPENIYYIFQLSVTYTSNNDYVKGYELINEAYRLLGGCENKSSYKYVYYQMALCSLKLEEDEMAKKVCEEGLEVDGEYIDLVFYLGKATGLLGEYEKSIQAYKKYINLCENYNNMNINFDVSLGMYTLGQKDEAIQDMIKIYFKLEKFNEVLKLTGQIEKDVYTQNVLELIISSAIKVDNIKFIKNFYEEKILGNKEKEDDFFKFYAKQCNSDEMYDVFSAYGNDYLKLHYLIYKYKKEDNEFKNIIDSIVFNKDFNIIEECFGDVIYYKIKYCSSISELLINVWDKNIDKYLSLLFNRYEDFSEIVVNYINNFKFSIDKNTLRINKILCRYILLTNKIKDEAYKEIFKLYLDTGIKGLEYLYKNEIIDEKYISIFKNEEEKFFVFMKKALSQKENKQNYIKYMRKALEVYPYMKKGIEILKDELVESDKMENKEFEDYKIQIKNTINDFINSEKLDEAEELIKEYESIVSNDLGVYSMKGILKILKGNFEEAKVILKEGLNIDENNFDLNYNLAYVYEQNEKFNIAFDYYCKARELCTDNDMKKEISCAIDKIKEKSPNLIIENRKKLVFFVKQGLDSFLGDIIDRLSDEYKVKKIIVTQYSQIDEGMKWADICWFEWCDELVAYGSKHNLAKTKKIICRLHRYEVFTDYPQKVVWENIDKLVIVTKHLKKFLFEVIPDIEKKVDIVTIVNGVNLEKYELKERKVGFNIAYVGYIHSRKNPALLLQIINELVKEDRRYKLYIAGEFQEPLVELYWNYQVKQMGLEKNVIFEGWQNNISKWLEDKNYILSTSIHESFGYGIAEAMSRGIKPVIHNFLFADEVWNKKYLFNSISEAVKMITEKAYNSEEYRMFIQDKYSLEKQIQSIKEILNDNYNDITRYNDFKEIEKVLNSKTNFECVKDLTIFIPTYNRALILQNDLEKGFKLGKQTKLIIDDGSDQENKSIINRVIRVNKNYGIEKLITNSDNKGVAKTLKIGINNIKTDYVQFCDDDDILICNNVNDIKSNIKKIGKEFAFVIPRYIVNMDLEGNISLGYDRKEFKDLNSSQILKYICMTGEMRALRAGGIFETETIKTSIPESIFTVSEDYIMIARVLSQFKDNKIYVSDSYSYIRRISNDTISRRIDKNKLFLNLFSMLVSGFYCFENNIIQKEEFVLGIRERGNLLQKIYGEGRKVSELLVEYLRGEISIKPLLSKINKHIECNELSILNIPEEILEILKYTKY